MQKKNTLAFAALMAIGLLGLTMSPSALAATVTTPATSSVSSDSYSGSSVSLPAIVVTETAAGDIPAGTLILGLPAGFIFDTASAANVSYAGTGLAGSANVLFPDNTHASVNVTASSTSTGSLTIGSSVPLKVKVSAGAPVAAPGNITLSAGTIISLTTTSSFGTLTQVPGAATKLSFSVQPPATVGVNTAFAASVSAQDQFGNVLTSDSGRAISITAIMATGTATPASLGGMTSVNTSSGISAFISLTYPQADTIKLQASSNSLPSIQSNAIAITTTSTSTPPLYLKNGMLVKVEGKDTVYMVVNGKLRPFYSAAIFHARGKKFQNILTLTQAQFAQVTVGSPIGKEKDQDENEGERDSSRIIIVLPAGSTTTTSSSLASLTNLPEGTIVKVSGNPTIYIVQGGQLKPFTSMAIFNAYKKDLNALKVISASELNTLTLGSPAAFPDGTLLKGSDSTIYVARGGQLYGIPNMQTLSKNGLSLKNLLKVKDQEIKDIHHAGTED